MDLRHERAPRSARTTVIAAMTGLTLSLLSAPHAHSNERELQTEESSRIQMPEKGWKLDWRERFNGSKLDEDWQVIQPDPTRGPRFMQYDASNVTVQNDALNITSYRHCGDVATIDNRHIAPCPDGVETHYSTGRVERVKHDIEGDFKLLVKAKMTLSKNELLGTRYEIWANNLTTYPDTRNLGYCIDGETPLGELDIAEVTTSAFTTANNITHCDNGELYDAPRKKRMPNGWLKNIVTFTVTRVDGRTEFTVNGEPVALRGTNRTIDRLSDFDGVTQDEYRQAHELPFGLIFSSTVKDSDVATILPPTKHFPQVDDDAPYKPHRLQILDVKKYSR